MHDQYVNHLGKFSLDNCRLDSLCFINKSYASRPTGIAFVPNGKLYGNCFGFSNYLQEVFFNWNSIYPDTCETVLESQYWLNYGAPNDCIISNEKGHIYDLTFDAMKYYPDEKKWELLGKMPDFYNKLYWQDYNCPNSGTLTRQGKDYYYIASVNTKSKPNDSLKFIKLNIKNPMLS